MKPLQILTCAFWATLVSWTIYIYNSASEDAIVTRGSLALAWENKKNVWEILEDTIKQYESAKEVSIGTLLEKDALMWFLNENVTLRMRIQGTSWYRNFVAWNLSIQDFRRRLEDAHNIELLIKSDSNILIALQYRWSWQSYLRWDTDPNLILEWEIPAIHSLEIFAKSNPKEYALIKENPLWDNPESLLTFVGNWTLMEWVNNRILRIEWDPWLKALMIQSGYNYDDLYRDSPQSEQGIYGLLNTYENWVQN
jgi:hypothetical protein